MNLLQRKKTSLKSLYINPAQEYYRRGIGVLLNLRMKLGLDATTLAKYITLKSNLQQTH